MTDPKQQAKDRDGWECRFCGMGNEEHLGEFDRGLHAHHIIKSNDGGADHPRNLITVCRECHKILENTQADALSRIMDEHAGVEVINPVDEIDIETLVSTVVRSHIVSVELVAETMGNGVGVYSDSDKAVEAYKDWGGCIKRNTVSIPDERASEIAEEVAEKLEERTGQIQGTLDELGGR